MALCLTPIHMKPLVLKFGGSSLSDSDKLLFVARKIAGLRRANPRIICVLSAPADITDNLLSLSSKFGGTPRERDALASCGEQISVSLMAMALRRIGVKAVSLNAFQAGIITDRNHLNAGIKKINSRRIKAELKKGDIVVVTGFQGVSTAGNLTTLGRGGSDLSAVYVAKYLGAGRCHLYSDVSGVYTANPSIVPEAKKLRNISHKEIIELYKSGTEVRQLKALELARENSIQIYLASSFSNEKGTLISKESGGDGGVACLSLKREPAFARITLIGEKLNAAKGLRKKILETARSGGFRVSALKLWRNKLEITSGKDRSSDFLRALHKKFI